MRRYNASAWSPTGRTIAAITLLLALFGIINIFSAISEDPSLSQLVSLEVNSGKQLVRLGVAIVLCSLLFVFTSRIRFFFDAAYPLYLFSLLLLIAALFIGREVAGAKSWLALGSVRVQPSEFMKLATALALARFFADNKKRGLQNLSVLIRGAAIVIVPMLLIILQGDTGSALVFSSFLIVFYREGMSKVVTLVIVSMGVLFYITVFFYQDYTVHIIVTLAVLNGLYYLFSKRTNLHLFAAIATASVMIFLVISTKFILTNVLKPHHKKRIEVLVNPSMDPLGMGWQVNQSKIAIGSGGVFGKGYFKGTQTNFQFIPDQSTDFIFCTVAEEFGFLGAIALVGFFALLFYYLLEMAESQNHHFSKVYGYCVFSILFFHFFVNIGMTMGLVPVIGIPLPLISYGGSSLMSTLLLIAIFLKLDTHREQFF